MLRRIMQIAVVPADGPNDVVYALCNDGALFSFSSGWWSEMPAIPQNPSLDEVVKLRTERDEARTKLFAVEQQINTLADLAGELMAAKSDKRMPMAGVHERYNVGRRMAGVLGLEDVLESDHG